MIDHDLLLAAPLAIVSVGVAIAVVAVAVVAVVAIGSAFAVLGCICIIVCIIRFIVCIIRIRRFRHIRFGCRRAGRFRRGRGSRIHSLRIITGDPKPQNFILSLDGRMLFPNFGRAKIYRFCSPVFFLCIGGELAKLRREGFQWDPALWNQFRSLYFKALHFPVLSRALIWASCEIAIGMRKARKRIQGQSPWS